MGTRASLSGDGLSFVIPAEAGIQKDGLDTGLRRYDGGTFIRQPESKEPSVNKQPSVYILASRRNGTLYIGVTSDLVKRLWEHRNDIVGGFTKRYGVHQLVWYELHESMESAIEREKRLKEWKRRWKLQLIESTNPNWQDLYHTIL
jgi:putative endonuclease